MGQGFAIIKDLTVIGIASRDKESLGTKSKYEKQSFAQIHSKLPKMPSAIPFLLFPFCPFSFSVCSYRT
ncbi:unnamed protein product [Prunus armeniaca]